jgi:serpin B
MGNTAFAIELYQAMREEPSLREKNIFGSPYGVSFALATAYAGARGETAREMADILHFTLPPETLHTQFRVLGAELQSRAGPSPEGDGKGFRLNLANSIWAEKTLPLRADFLSTVEGYDEEVKRVDFEGQPDGSRQAINDWVEEQTGGRIEDLLPSGAVGKRTRLVLVDAIYFNAAWLQPFHPADTKMKPFYRLDGSEVTVDRMAKNERLRYGEGNGYGSVEIPYEGGKLAFYVILPEVGKFEEVESALSAGELQALVEGMQPRQIALEMPKVTLGGDALRLKSVLSRMGMRHAFDPSQADFSGMVERDPAKFAIDEMHHKAFLRADEAGTEAAAATGAVFNVTSFVPPITFTIDRPFIFFILDVPTRAMLFGGRILDPNAE